MKKTVACLLLAAFTATFVSGCMTVMSPAQGALFAELKAPLAVGDSNVSSSKVGKSMCRSIFGLVAIDDASITAAMKDGNITKINHVDYEVRNFLGIYAEFTTVVYGE